jgi:membrane protein implicated in regulation of membrane protease activity
MRDDARGARSTVAEPELAGLTAVAVGVALLALLRGDLEAAALAILAVLVVLGCAEALSRRGADPYNSTSAPAARVRSSDGD